MVDFSSLKSSATGDLESEPRKLFQRLVKPEGVNELYASQGDVLDQWHGSRTSKDNIIKLPTGGGKSLVGLLIAKSTLIETRAPVLYLAPTRQLVDQLCAEAGRFGIPAEPYVDSKTGIPSAFIDATAVGVATYDACFNGMSKFGTTDRQSEVGTLGALILDDAHAAFDSVRDNFTFTVKSSDHLELYRDLCARFRQDFDRLDRVRTFDDVVSGQEPFVLDVPYWAWLEKSKDIGAAIRSYGHEKIDRWAWSHLRDEFQVCQALISKKAFSIVSLVPLVDRSTAYARADRRIYMSATISDDSEVVRTFGVSAKGASNPIVAASLAGSGERMILSPALIKSEMALNEKVIVGGLVKRASIEDKNTVILTPSFERAKSWSDLATVPATGEQSVSLIHRLKKTRGQAVVLPRRYDGVDLPGDDCRVLVLDGLPYGESDHDNWRLSTMSTGSSGAVLAQRIEQAIGRGSRGSSDYCVVILMGSDLVTWIGRKSNQANLSASTRRQLEIGLVVSESVKSQAEFEATAWQCLNRDSDWRKYHASEMASAALPLPPNVPSINIAEFERQGIDALRVRSFTNALSAFDSAIDIATDRETKGWFHQLKARALFQSGDEAESNEKQGKAYGLNRRLTAPIGQITVSTDLPITEQAAVLVSKVAQYLHSGVVLSHFDQSTSYLSATSSPNQFEAALAQLLDYIGFKASRPDEVYKVGPDVLALSVNGPALVIEAKSRRHGKNKFTKTLHGQVMNHDNWYSTHYGADKPRQRIVVAASGASEDNAGTNGTLVMTFSNLSQIISDARSVIKQVADAQESEREAVAVKLLNATGLTAAGIINRLASFSDAAEV